MKKIIFLILSFNLLFGVLENYNSGTWNLQGASASTESKWNISIRQLVTGANPMDILAVQEAGVLPKYRYNDTKTSSTCGSWHSYS